MSHFTLGVVNVGGGECRGGECRTIIFQHIFVAALSCFVFFLLYLSSEMHELRKIENSLTRRFQES